MVARRLWFLTPEDGSRTPYNASHVRDRALASLTPDRILDALDSVGIAGDGRLLGLNSYENRVYLAYCEDAPPVVVKFYRPARWNDAQILEEHAFVAELVEREIPAVAPLSLRAATLHRFADCASPCIRSMAAARPSSTIRRRSNGSAASSAALRGRKACVVCPSPRARYRDVRRQPRASWAHDFVPPDLLDAYRTVSAMALAGVRHCFERAGAVAKMRLHGDCHASNVLWTDDGPHFVDFDDARAGPAVQDLWMLLSGDRAAMTRQLSDVLDGYEDFARSTGANCIWSRRCARCVLSTMRRGSRGAGTTRRFRRRSPGSIRNATGRIAFWNCASRLPQWKSPLWREQHRRGASREGFDRESRACSDGVLPGMKECPQAGRGGGCAGWAAARRQARCGETPIARDAAKLPVIIHVPSRQTRS